MAKPTAEEVEAVYRCLDNSDLLGMFAKRLSFGLDLEHDAATIKSFCDATGVNPAAMLARMRTFFHSGNNTVN
jgi:hypothetical protein